MANNWVANNVQCLNAGDSLYEYPKNQSNSFLYSFTGSSILNLNPDQTFTSLGYRQHFFFGKWFFDKASNTLRLISAADTCELKVVDMLFNKMELKGNVIGYFNMDSSKVVQAKASNKPDTLVKKITVNIDKSYISGGSDDYFALKNNLWRIKPNAPETPAEVNKRIVGSLRFTIMYLNARKKDPVISLEPIALPITIASNGIQMWPADDTRTTWKEVFYDDADADSAYQMLNRAMHGSFNVPNNKDHVALDLDLFKQLLNNMR